MNSDNDLLHQPHPINQKPNSSFKSLKSLGLLTILTLIVLLAGIGSYLLRIKTSKNTSQSTQSGFLQPTPTFYNYNLILTPTIEDMPPAPITTEYPLLPTPTDDPALTGWSTYGIKIGGFTFKVPPEWNIFYAEGDKEKGYSDLVFRPHMPKGIELGPTEDNFAMVEIRLDGNEFESNTPSEGMKTTEGRSRS